MYLCVDLSVWMCLCVCVCVCLCASEEKEDGNEKLLSSLCTKKREKKMCEREINKIINGRVTVTM